jgi:SAM-dependent methyltransferase
MKTNTMRLSASLVILLITSGIMTMSLYGQQFKEPQSGQRGKDVVWVPTPQALVDIMLEMAEVTSKDYVMDLGSGDGRLVISAAKLGANALGVEYDSDMVELSKRNAAKEGLGNKARFIQADLFTTDLSKATVITLFLMTDLNIRLRPKLLELKPGTRIVSNTFSMGDWKADETEVVAGDCQSWCNALMWIIPAKVDGKWKSDSGEFNFDQKYQMVNGEFVNGQNKSTISNGRLKGTKIEFTADNVKYEGEVNGNTISGTRIINGKPQTWTATR